MPSVLLAALLVSLFASTAANDTSSQPPKLLLSAKLLRRLKRDRDRQTVRWTAFETRVKNVPDSSERGFELALYFAITGDDTSGKQATMWAAGHPCERRQRALIQDWVGPIPAAACATPASLRDQIFETVISGGDLESLVQTVRAKMIPQVAAGDLSSPTELYALAEIVTVLRASSGQDLRDAAPQFFRNLPIEFLLSLKPQEVQKPGWMTHSAALALVSVDPNLEASQFLQGWAMEDSQTVREGPGVAYELLWADPYLPGIAYQNLEPWLYDEDDGRLLARSDWTPNACWIAITKDTVRETNCPAGWRDAIVHFGSLTLIPAPPKCFDVPKQEVRQAVIYWKLPDHQTMVYHEQKEITAHADATGMWRPGVNVQGRVCRR